MRGVRHDQGCSGVSMRRVRWQMEIGGNDVLMDDIFYYSSNIAVAFREVELSELRRSLVETSVGLEDRPLLSVRSRLISD